MTTALCSKKKEVTEARKKSFIKDEPVPLPTEPEERQDVQGLICWWCVHALPQKPCIHLPVRYDDKRKIFTTVGNFCSWQCAKAYALDMSTARSGEIQMLLALARSQAIGRYTPLWPAPKRQALKCFGGTMTIEEFRSYGGSNEPPQVHFPYEKRMVVSIGVSENIDPGTKAPKGQGAAETSGRLAAIENSTASNETLKLKRNKPLARATSKLESALGIIRKGKE